MNEFNEPNTVIEYNDSLQDMIVKMADGNVGALGVLPKLLAADQEVDPDSAHPLTILLTMDMQEIRGERIWVLYKYCCGQDLTRTIAAIRAAQLGLIEVKRLHEYIESREKLDFIADVQGFLPNFGRNQP